MLQRVEDLQLGPPESDCSDHFYARTQARGLVQVRRPRPKLLRLPIGQVPTIHSQPRALRPQKHHKGARSNERCKKLSPPLAEHDQGTRLFSDHSKDGSLALHQKGK